MHKSIWDLAIEYSTGFGQGRSAVEHGQVSRRTNDLQKKGKAVPGPYPLGLSWSAGPPCLHSYLSSGLSSIWSVAFLIWFQKLLSSRLPSPYLQSMLCVLVSSPLSCCHFCVCIQPTPISRSPGSGVEPLPLDVPSRSSCAPAVPTAWNPSDSLLPGLPGA